MFRWSSAVRGLRWLTICRLTASRISGRQGMGPGVLRFIFLTQLRGALLEEKRYPPPLNVPLCLPLIAQAESVSVVKNRDDHGPGDPSRYKALNKKRLDPSESTDIGPTIELALGRQVPILDKEALQGLIYIKRSSSPHRIGVREAEWF